MQVTITPVSAFIGYHKTDQFFLRLSNVKYKAPHWEYGGMPSRYPRFDLPPPKILTYIKSVFYAWHSMKWENFIRINLTLYSEKN